jgi:acetate kinase
MREPMLVLNAGSSSIKFSVFETNPDRSLAVGSHGEVSQIGPRLKVVDARGSELARQKLAGDGHDAGIAAIHVY